jgi:hypothetical protein
MEFYNANRTEALLDPELEKAQNVEAKDFNDNLINLDPSLRIALKQTKEGTTQLVSRSGFFSDMGYAIWASFDSAGAKKEKDEVKAALIKKISEQFPSLEKPTENWEVNLITKIGSTLDKAPGFLRIKDADSKVKCNTLV